GAGSSHSIPSIYPLGPYHVSERTAWRDGVKGKAGHEDHLLAVSYHWNPIPPRIQHSLLCDTVVNRLSVRAGEIHAIVEPHPFEKLEMCVPVAGENHGAGVPGLRTRTDMPWPERQRSSIGACQDDHVHR